MSLWLSRADTHWYMQPQYLILSVVTLWMGFHSSGLRLNNLCHHLELHPLVMTLRILWLSGPLCKNMHLYSGHEEGSVAIPCYSRTMGHLGPVVKPFLPLTAHAVFPIPLPPLWMAWEPLWHLSLLAIQTRNKNTYPTQDREGYAVVINPKHQQNFITYSYKVHFKSRTLHNMSFVC